ncbi:hypothetical protein CPY3401_06250 [Helicobacter pylori]|nr:hypothetical protein CPY3401_06250 [Helicobacter pylori]
MPKSYELEKFLRYMSLLRKAKSLFQKIKRQNILTKRSKILEKLKDNDANDIIVNS